ncbi:hypothetical protein HELRODRAFT_184238 [Helobdella robusta]|uniref:Zinc finger PHD-type domain-containing protein n=1 Tax=Helobdella robusta TaxID=6412 RepID=T1FKT9_HELRO|nr:hypothetical protein HELRODRAFT_184238 [Helobdella robusta]ESO04488.1 hypothetical protein HELRODRAFT_184238 [Helobdella robusta]
MALTLQQCPVCFNHYRSTPDGKLCRHGGKVKGQECSGSRKKVDPLGARAASPLVDGRAEVYDHIPKPCRKKFAHDLNALLTAVCNDPGDPVHWVRLHCFVPYVLQKTSRGGRRGNLSSAVRLVCSPEGLAESSPATFDKLCSIHPKISVDRRVFPALTLTAGCVSPAEMLRAVKSFKNGSSGGLDGLRLQHLKDVFSGSLPIDDTLNSLTQFINLILSGACPLSVRRLPKLMYFLRTSKYIDPSKLGEFDGALRTALSSICNVQRFLRVCVLENIQLNADMCNERHFVLVAACQNSFHVKCVGLNGLSDEAFEVTRGFDSFKWFCDICLKKLCNVKTLSNIVSDNNDEINLKVEKIIERNGFLKNELKLLKEMLNSNSAKLDSPDRPVSKLSAEISTFKSDLKSSFATVVGQEVKKNIECVNLDVKTVKRKLTEQSI